MVDLSPYIDITNLHSNGGKIIPNGISLNEWNIEVLHSHISREIEKDDYKNKIGNVFALPEILFGKNYLKISNLKHNFEISFNALDALNDWKNENLPSFKIDIAEEWQRCHEKELKENTIQEINYDWTFTTNYKGTIKSKENIKFEECKEEMDWSLLKSKSEPIIFYDSIDLYESELNDHGICQLKVLIRCMPKCWFILLRYFLRIDNNFVRLRETRLFNRFDKIDAKNIIFRQIKYWESSFSELNKIGAPNDGISYTDADSTATVMQSIFPFGIKTSLNEKLNVC